MAKPITVTYQGAESSFDHKKLDRSKLYGKRQRMVLDPNGERCERARLTDDGAILVRSGMAAQAYFDPDGNWVPNSELVGLSAAGEPVDSVGSTLGQAQEAREVSPEEALDLNVRAVYVLTPEAIDAALSAALDEGKLFACDYSYRGGYNLETALIVRNDEGTFALIGSPAESEWLELKQLPVETYDDDEDDDDDLDFEMF
ncbi:MAG: hypothetical protein EP330_19375 [Deltaproteobacteria bacterium]|nr:MAG: hypothetical protein EP330_19375 [Deltaproteobacteria bacterium]